ncbi:MAG TPA: TIGR03086 family metal-binding protein, partial [Acidimicrobiales bacterium]
MTIEKSVLVPLDAEQTFALVTEPERMRRWFAVSARIDLRAGGDFRWTVVPGGNASGTVTELEPGRRVVFTWGWEGNEAVPPGSSTVTITLEPVAGGTTVRLVHDGLSEEQGNGHLGGWTHFLDRLVEAAREGDAGFDSWNLPNRTLDQLTAAESSLALCQAALRDLKDEDLSAQTPCAKFTVSELADHLLENIVHLAAAVDVTVLPSRSGPLESRIADAGQALLEGWRRRGTEGTVKVGPMELPADLAVRIIIVEFLVHAWDFAQATGRTLPEDDALAVYALEQTRGLMTPDLRDGDRFAAEVLVGPDADAISR